MLDKLVPKMTIARMWQDSVSTKFSDSLLEMLYFTHLRICKPGEYLHYDKAFCSWHVLGRNTLAQNFLGDSIFFTDCDHAFAPDLLVRLLEEKKKVNAQVISAIYQYKNPPFSAVFGIWDENDHLLPVYDFPRDTPFPVGACGAGGLLVDREVFERIANELKEAPFDTIGGLSEDYSFCLRCKRLGIPVWVAPQIETHHMIPHLLSIQDYKPDRTQFQPASTTQGIITKPESIGESGAVK